MSRSIPGRRTDRKNVRQPEVQSRPSRRRTLPSARRSRHASPRLIGLPISTTVPNLKGLRWRYCSRWDEEPAAHLGKSLLRLGICRAEDWSGSAVDFVERGFRRFCNENGADEARKIWSGFLRIMDHPFELTEQERNSAETENPTTTLYLVGEYDAAASIPIGATLAHLEREHELLPAAFYKIFIHNLWKWMRVYDYSDALEHAEMWMQDLDEDSEAESVYPKVAQNVPPCLQKHSKLGERNARRFLQQIEPSLRTPAARQLVSHVLELDALGRGREHAWAGRLAEQIPAIGDFLNDAESCGPGCLISWYEGDEITASFDEEMQNLGQNGPLEPPIVLLIQLDKFLAGMDSEVKRVFDYAGAMLRSLALAARIVDIIRELYDEHLRKHRLKSGLQAEPGPAGVRDQ
jgi:hypothetical protein